ncbi:MAG: diaminohydroxyphosphoribosylaminopyrimidine deaminase [Hyphomicrobiales bacterium]|jgi:riboflavin-specific deaminase-like protein|nr:diaminohydroxyphosphoribosylaminopyrimidine deaminase [Hyphomicrobiales bacterium]
MSFGGEQPDGPTSNNDGWDKVPILFRTSGVALPAPWEERFGPLRHGTVDELMVVGQLGQSIDGRIATATGHSKYINGPAGLDHLHRLRAVVDAVLVGVRTAITDDPLLTVRRVAGQSPVRIVLDPNGRLSPEARVLADDGTRRLVIRMDNIPAATRPGVEIVALPAPDGEIAPASILTALAERGFRRILIEGGANTVSRFIAAGCLDRLHVVVAPIIIGAGPSGVTLKPIARADEALRSPMRTHLIGDEVLLDCDLTAHRVPVGCAKKST